MQAHTKPMLPMGLAAAGKRSGTPDSLEVNTGRRGESAGEARRECEAHVRAVRADHAAELKARDVHAAQLRSRLEAAGQELSTQRQVGARLQEAEGRIAELARENAEMRKAEDDHADEAAGRVREAEYLERLREMVAVAVPVLSEVEALVMDRTRAEREERDKKVLRILKARDARVAELEGENVGLRASAERHRLQISILESALEKTNRQMEEVIYAKEEQARVFEEKLGSERDRGIALQMAVEDLERRMVEGAAARSQVAEQERRVEMLEAEAENMLRWA